MNSCIHSGTIAGSGDLPTTWYNYVLASAGTIANINSDDTTGNITTATESVCPKGWVLPSQTQTQSIGNDTSTYVANFNPVLGGYYGNGTLADISTRGSWWSSTAYNGGGRHRLVYNDNNLLYSLTARRYNGYYIRCVQAP